MQIVLRMIPIMLAAGLAFAGCKDAGDRPGTSAPGTEKMAGGVRTDGTKMSNADLEKAIKAKLESDSQIREANLRVNADANENKVSIKGTVPSQDVRAKAVELAKSVQPNLTINDEIEVKPAG